MNFFTLIKLDYLQRTRSYAFLITLSISLAISYTLVPAPNANYSTIRIENFVGYYNSAWFGYVTAIMTSLFLSLIGFYLINNSIETDIRTKVGQITASTKIGNFTYLSSKVFSNFLVLLTILILTFFMGIALFFLYQEGYPFELYQFVKPYVIITIPTLFVVAVLAVVFEVFLGKSSVLQNIAFFCLFSFLMLSSKNTTNNFYFDLFGSKIFMHQLENEVRQLTNTDLRTNLSIGYIIGNVQETKKFYFNGMNFPTSFLISRFVWVLIGIGFIGITALFFHRFDLKRKRSVVKKKQKILTTNTLQEVSLLGLPKITVNYGLFSLLKTEFLLLCRKGKKWLWIFNFVGMVALAFAPLSIAHQIVLPILWFFQVGRLSELTTKEISNKVHYFAFASYKPLTRLLASQIITGMILLLFLASPLAIRLMLSLHTKALFSVLLGGVFIVLFATLSGILTQRKKLFEVLFFIITYANINKIPFLDYFGGVTHGSFYILNLGISILILITLNFVIRNYQLKKL